MSVFVTGVRSSARTACTTIASSSRIGPAWAAVRASAWACGVGAAPRAPASRARRSSAAAPLAAATAVIAPATSAAVHQRAKRLSSPESGWPDLS